MRSACLVLIASLLGLLSTHGGEPEKPAQPKAPPVFETNVVPIFEMKCNRCHGARERKGKLDMRTMPALLKGGVSGAALVPGNSAKSLLVELIHYNEMPPKKVQPRVSPEELKLIKAWIDAGAPEKKKAE
jgi:cytochrome c